MYLFSIKIFILFDLLSFSLSLRTFGEEFVKIINSDMLNLLLFFAGMGKEGWYITKNICAELAILGAGYYTHIPSVQVIYPLHCSLSLSLSLSRHFSISL